MVTVVAVVVVVVVVVARIYFSFHPTLNIYRIIPISDTKRIALGG